jgi:hypothetical protein
VSSKIRAVQAHAIELLKADPWFSEISIIADLPGDIATQVEEALAKMGISIVCLMAPSNMTAASKNVTLKVVLAFMVSENVLLNRDVASGGSGKTAEEVVERMLPILHYADNGLSISHRLPQETFKVGSPAFEPVQDEEYLMFRVNFETEVRL